MMVRPGSNRHVPPAKTGVPFLPIHGRLYVIEQMLADIETATAAGQRYVMSKVTTQLRQAAVSADHGLADAQRRSIVDGLAGLSREAERLLPNAEAFVRSARMLAESLSPV